MSGVPSRGKLPDQSTIEVWRIDLDRPLSLGVNIDNIFSIEERNRADRLIFARDANRFRHCRAMLRLGLAWFLGRPPQEIALTMNRHGKPSLAEASALKFNVTHSEGMGLIAFTTVGEVGIDVEAIEREVEALEMASANFTMNEAAMVAAANTAQEQASIFLHLWTRKEAVLKAVGRGIVDGLNAVDVSQEPVNRVRLKDDIADSYWRIRDMEGIEGFVGAIAAPAGDWSILQKIVTCEEVLGGLVERNAGFLYPPKGQKYRRES
jgi:4'-phosphopantetheinyl transferase